MTQKTQLGLMALAMRLYGSFAGKVVNIFIPVQTIKFDVQINNKIEFDVALRINNKIEFDVTI